MNKTPHPPRTSQTHRFLCYCIILFKRKTKGSLGHGTCSNTTTAATTTTTATDANNTTNNMYNRTSLRSAAAPAPRPVAKATKAK